MVPWTSKYRPTSLKEVYSQDKAILVLKNFIENFSKQKKKALLLYGPPGCGKTSSIYAVMKDLDLEILEVNASDVRNKEAIETIIGASLKQQSLFQKQKVILLDEVDGVSGTKDRGGVAALVPLIQETKFPIICTANDAYSDKLKALRKECILVGFNPLNTKDVLQILKKICEFEKIKFDESELSILAEKAEGDLRGAINDLETLSSNSKELLNGHSDAISNREKKLSILKALSLVLKNKDSNITKEAFQNIDEDMDEVIMWMDQNLPKEYFGESLARAFDHLSRADVFKGRIRRWQYWRFLVYMDALLSGGIGSAKDTINANSFTYEQNKRPLTIWIYNNKLAKKKAMAEAIAKRTHTSKKESFKNIAYLMPLLNSEKGKGVIEELGLDEELVEGLK